MARVETGNGIQGDQGSVAEVVLESILNSQSGDACGQRRFGSRNTGLLGWTAKPHRPDEAVAQDVNSMVSPTTAPYIWPFTSFSV